MRKLKKPSNYRDINATTTRNSTINITKGYRLLGKKYYLLENHGN